MINNVLNEKGVDFTGQQQVFDVIEQACELYANKPAYSCLGQTLTFAEIGAKSLALANYLQSIKLQPGDKIAIQLPNLIQFPIAVYAAMRCGLILVNTNPLYTEREMKHQFTDAGVKAIIILSDLLPKLEHIITDTAIEHVITTSATDLLMPDNEADAAVTANNGVEYHHFNAALVHGHSAKPLSRVSGELDDLAVLQYTGGTTGLSKGAMLSHRNLLANVQQTYQRFSNRCIDGEDVYVAPLPLYHIYAFQVNLILAASHGTHNILIPNPRDLDSLVAAIKPFKFTTFTGINTLFVGLCHHQAFKALDFSSLKLTVSGGSALTDNASKIWHQVTGCTISEGYGLSETAPVVSFNEPGNERLGTIGMPLVDTDVQIWNDDNQAVLDGEEGELVVKGPQVMSGYWQQAQATEQAIINGYFKTGDMAIKCPDGRLKIVDRKKDMIIVSGFNVYPNEIENILSEHDAIVEAAVIGKEDQQSGERVCAYVVLEQGVKLNESALVDYCKSQLTAYKVPKELHFIDELPKSTVGKVLRRELRA